MPHSMDPPSALQLNGRALHVVEHLLASLPVFGAQATLVEGGGRLIDLGIKARGGLAAGVALARICMADLAQIQVEAAPLEISGPLAACPRVHVSTDHPLLACMGSQYAGWQISVGKFFAMGSGPFRAAHGREELFGELIPVEKATAVVGVLETSTLPGPEVFAHVAERTGVPASSVTLLVARTKSVAGSLQVVARSVETALHKLHVLGFDLRRVVAGMGSAPLPPPARNDLAALGTTNDAVLYGGCVTLWVTGDDASIEEIGPRVPSCASRDHGAPFAQVFERYGRDFYKVDPALFSPARVTFFNVDTGTVKSHGAVEPELLQRSFFGA